MEDHQVVGRATHCGALLTKHAQLHIDGCGSVANVWRDSTSSEETGKKPDESIDQRGITPD